MDVPDPVLDVERLRERIVNGSPWTSFDAVAETGSTNADLADGARSGRTPVGSVLLAELQVAGRGRLGRGWQAPTGTALTFSVLVEPGVPPARWGWLPLLSGLALAAGVAAASDVRPQVKWPNDLLAPGGRKLAGILAERVDTPQGALAVVGMGLNVGQTLEQLPVPTATSLRVETGQPVDRADVLVAVLNELGDLLRRWRDADGDPDAGSGSLREAYRQRSATLGHDVQVMLPGDQVLTGTAVDVDVEGRLVVRRADGSAQAVAAGDVVHVRAVPQ